jgi:hypothetical protein
MMGLKSRQGFLANKNNKNNARNQNSQRNRENGINV